MGMKKKKKQIQLQLNNDAIKSIIDYLSKNSFDCKQTEKIAHLKNMCSALHCCSKQQMSNDNVQTLWNSQARKYTHNRFI